ncbi:hypothetical protein NK6_3477 [Bradyrhizobium diazoefficiens]|uniref:Uncharacterized protein n=1 Tax=Bradyrhizobium diazoefficiens TaxID=1355477 RepID=A0A0E4BP46_9BRAD|nr:hypothetical protein NK6_3477 [Bradyrhizobium diazoefficiens]
MWQCGGQNRLISGQRGVLSRHRIEPDSPPTLGKVDKQFGNHVSGQRGTKPARPA